MRPALAWLLLLLLSCWVTPTWAAEPLEVSLIQLIANPKTYDGKAVRVVGFVSLEREGHAVYLHQDDYKHGITKNGLWLEVTDDIRQKQKDYDQKYLLIEGVFKAQDTGHMALYSGALHKISRWEMVK